MRGVLLLALVAALLAAIGVVGLLFREPAAPPLPSPDLGKLPTLRLFHSGERAGYIEPCGCDDALIGGFPRGQSVLQRAVRAGKPTLFLENGDLNDEAEDQDRLKYRFQIRALQATGCAAYNLGELDLTLGLDFLQEMQREAGFPFLSANLTGPGGEAVFERYTVIRMKVGDRDRQILVIGVLADSKAGYADHAGLTLEVAREAIREVLEEAKEGTDLRLLLFHGDRDEAKETLRDLDGIHLVLATSHDDLEEPFEVISEGLPPIVGTGLKGKVLGRVPIGFDRSGPNIGASDPILLTNLIPDASEASQILQEYYEAVSLSGFIDEMALVDPPEGGLYVGSPSCDDDCHPGVLEAWKQTRHSQALATLKAKGRETDPECVGCHVVGFGFVSGYSRTQTTPGLDSVGCESCHGVGSIHVRNPQPTFGHIPDPEKSCLACHNPEHSPNFDFDTYWSKIVHAETP